MNDKQLSKPFSQEMFTQKKGGNFGNGISSLSNSIGLNRRTEVTNYMEDYANVEKY